MHAANHLDIHDLVIKDFGAGEIKAHWLLRLASS